jgi:hypothetical protein
MKGKQCVRAAPSEWYVACGKKEMLCCGGAAGRPDGEEEERLALFRNCADFRGDSPPCRVGLQPLEPEAPPAFTSFCLLRRAFRSAFAASFWARMVSICL